MAPDARVFGDVCRKHAAAKTADSNDKLEAPLSAMEEEQVKAILEPATPKDNGFTSSTVRSIEGLVNDLCDAFLDYGAQYPFFTKCLRLFLANGFPAKIRCTVIQRLRGALHLLSLESDGELAEVLPAFLAGGMPSKDASVRDPPEILDCIAAVFVRGALVRPDDVFFASWTVGMLARSFAISLSLGGTSGISVSKRRLQNLEDSMFLRIAETAALLLSGEGTLEDLVAATLERDPEKRTRIPCDFTVLKQKGETARWDETISKLRALKNTT